MSSILVQHPYIYTFDRKKVYPFALHPGMISMIDLANGLGRECRFGNQSDVFYSVAQHSVLIAQAVPKPLRLWALLHDASEAYTGDMPKPLKVAIQDFKAFENQLSDVIFKAFGLDGSCPALIKTVDERIVIDEALQLFRNPPDWAVESKEHRLGITLTPWSSEEARTIYLRILSRTWGLELSQGQARRALRIVK